VLALATLDITVTLLCFAFLFDACFRRLICVLVCGLTSRAVSHASIMPLPPRSLAQEVPPTLLMQGALPMYGKSSSKQG
jgi:hypothetical protein